VASKPPDDKAAAVRAWMKAKGLKVDDTDWDRLTQTYIWIHYPKGYGRPLVLGIARDVLTDTPLFILHELLDRHSVAAELKARPGTALVLVRRGDRIPIGGIRAGVALVHPWERPDTPTSALLRAPVPKPMLPQHA
jgi:hypothetical protein